MKAFGEPMVTCFGWRIPLLPRRLPQEDRLLPVTLGRQSTVDGHNEPFVLQTTWSQKRPCIVPRLLNDVHGAFSALGARVLSVVKPEVCLVSDWSLVGGHCFETAYVVVCGGGC
jgi:hypothetical protein